MMSAAPDPRDMTELFRRLADREAGAFGEIAARLWRQLCGSARRRLRQGPELDGIYDEEDAVQSGMSYMWRGILEGRMAPPDGVDSFLRLARTIVLRRIASHARDGRVARRHPDPSGAHEWTTGPFQRYVPDDLSLYECGLPGPEAGLIAREESMWLLSLVDPVVRDIAEGRLQGLTITEIAVKYGSSRRTIERVLREIMRIWTDALRERGT